MKLKEGNYKWVALALLCATYFLQQGTRQIYNITLPQIKTDFGVSDTSLGIIVTAFFLVYSVVVPFAGVLADVFRRKWMIVAGVLLFSIGTLVSGFAGGLLTMLVMYGVVAAVGQCFFPSSATSLIAQLHPKTRATALSIFQTALYAGVVICSCVSGWLAGLGPGGWRKAFWIFGALGFVWLIALIFGLRDTPPLAREGGEDAEKASVMEAILATLRKPSAILLTLGFGMCMYGSRGFLTWMPTFMGGLFPDLSPAAVAFNAVVWFYLGAIVGIAVASRVSDKFAPTRAGVRMEVNIIGLALNAPCVWWVSQAPSVAICCLGLAAWGFAHGIYDSNFFASLYDVVSPRYRAAATGVFLCLGFILGAFAPTVLGWMNDTMSPRAGFASLAVFYLAGAFFILLARIFFLKRDYVKS